MKKFGFDNLLVSDREIFDALYSQKQKLPDEKLLAICRNIGIFLSTNESRESICQYISTQFKDWYSLKTILDNLNYNEKSKKTSSLLISGASLADFKEVIKDIAQQFSDNQMITRNNFSKISSAFNNTLIHFSFSGVMSSFV